MKHRELGPFFPHRKEFSLYHPAMNPLSGVLGEAWQMYKAFARHLLTIAFVIYLIAAVIAALLGLVGGSSGAARFPGRDRRGLPAPGDAGQGGAGRRDGRADMSLGETYASPCYLGRVAVASILAGIAISIGLVLLIAPGLFLITIWAVIVPVIVLEGSGARRPSGAASNSSAAAAGMCSARWPQRGSSCWW